MYIYFNYHVNIELGLSPGKHTEKYVERQAKRDLYYKERFQSSPYKKRRMEKKADKANNCHTNELKEGTCITDSVQIYFIVNIYNRFSDKFYQLRCCSPSVYMYY